MNIEQQIEKELDAIGRTLVQRFRKELVNQGHIATGKLHDTTKHKVHFKGDVATIKIVSKTNYSKAVNDGTKPHTPNLDAILDWIDDKKISYSSENEKHQIAAAIIRRIEIEGTPTKGSYNPDYTSNGYRKGYINRVVGFSKKGIKNKLQKKFGDIIKTEFRKATKK
jgi:hypothetical protein|tara:strand:+ start:238 stop:738 length:501 start_codon:yes stop_codon:yes gene_type:complete